MWDAFTNGFIARHGVPEVLITDNGGEFTATEWERYLHQMGVEHHRTTPVHPQSNGRTEHFNRTLKEMLQKLVNNASDRWEGQLNTALLAYGTSVSTTTRYTPFFLLYGRRSRMPLTTALRVSSENAFGNRLDDLARALKVARAMTEDSRKYNRQRLERRANARDIRVGDSVVLKADDRSALTSRWDPQWEVTKVNGTVVHVRHQQTGRLRTVNREKARIVDPTISWEEYHPRPPRAPPRRRIYNYRPCPLNSRDNDLLQQPAGAPEQQVAPPDSDNDVDLDQSGDASENHSPPTEPMLTQDDDINERPTRQQQLTERARLAAQDNDPDNLIGFHYRKRHPI